MTQRCPLIGIAETKMTKNSFISACLARQAKNVRFDPCLDCQKGQAINNDEWPGAPTGITIFVPKKFVSIPIIYPEKKSKPKTWARGRRALYPFASLKLGETYAGEVENKERSRSAACKIARTHGKKFVNRIEGDKIIFERVK